MTAILGPSVIDPRPVTHIEVVPLLVERSAASPRSIEVILLAPPFLPQTVVDRQAVPFLRRLLYIDALLSALAGLALVAVPGFLLVTVMGQPPYPDYGFLRLLGVALFVLALMMVLVAHRIEDLWWWSWSFVILGLGGAAVTTLQALFGLPEGAAAWPWLLMAAVSWGITLALLWGLAYAGR
jgi:hypothetical protein